MKAVKNFIEVVGVNIIDVVVKNGVVRSSCVADTPEVRRAAVAAAQELRTESGDARRHSIANFLNAELSRSDLQLPVNDCEWSIWMAALEESKRWETPLPELNNEWELTVGDLHHTLQSISYEIKKQRGCTGRPRVVFKDGTDTYRMLLQENNVGFNVSGTLNGAVAYQINTTIFGKESEIGDVILQIAGAPKTATAERFFKN